MANELTYQFNLGRNGTSQAERMLEALGKDFVHVDERSIRDLLLFAQKFARELNFYDGQNQATGDWRGFLGENGGFIDSLAAYLENPSDFLSDTGQLAELASPHRVLFLTFLQLYKDFSQNALNQYTERHLNHYFREILGFEPKDAEPDHVHIMMELVKGFKEEKLFLAQNTALNGGKDEAGNPLIYRTQADLMINRAQIAQLRSVFVNKTVDKLSSFDFSRDFIAMMKLALGEDLSGALSPGGELPAVNFLANNSIPTDAFLKKELSKFLAFVGSSMRMTFADFRKLIRLRQNRLFDLNEWALINTELSNIAAALSRPNPAFSDPKDFITNFTEASNSDPLDSGFFSTLQSVSNIYELYDELEWVLDILAQNPASNRVFYENRRDDLLGFIHENYYGNPGIISHNPTIVRFRAMMAARVHIRDEWREMLELVEQQAANQNLSLDLETPDFEQLLIDAYGLVTIASFFNRSHSSVNSADDYYEQMILVEHYFALHAEEIAQLLGGNAVEELLSKAHIQKNSYKRRVSLNAIRTGTGFNNMLLEAFGRPMPGDPLPTLPNAYGSLQLFYLGEVEGVSDENLPPEVRAYIENSLAMSLPHFRFVMEIQRDATSVPDFEAPPWQWERVALILEKAESKIRGVKLLPAPSLSHLQGIHASEDAKTVVLDQQEESYSSWETFGSADMPYARLGMMLSSPMLNLEAGNRTITLDLYIDPTSITADEYVSLQDMLQLQQTLPFSLWLSGEKDWTQLPYEVTFPSMIDGIQVDAIRFVLNLEKDADPVMQLPEDHADRFSADAALRILLDKPTAYELFSSIQFLDVNLQVIVTELAVSAMRNDQLIIKQGEPFEPFSSRPRPGSRLSFTHPEIAAKKLSEISLNVEWMGLPDFNSTYVNYSSSKGDRKVAASFNAQLRMQDAGFVRKYTDDPQRNSEKNIGLFSAASGNYSLNLAQEITGTDFPAYDWQEDAALAANVFDSDRYFFLELGSLDFGHDEYPRLAAEKANQLAIDIATSSKNSYTTSDYQVNPPYTPQIQSFSINYIASENGISLEQFSGKSKLFHLHPFGYKATAAGGDYVLARYANEGGLYLGLEKLNPPLDLSLLFQMAEGSADPDIPAPIILWDYLQGDEWKRLEDKGKILSDSTNGLLNSGIIRLRIPGDADTQHQLMPSGYHWLRISAPINSQGLSDTINIHTQAVLATLDKEGVAATHFNKPLAPESIRQLMQRNPSIKGVIQPYESFGGRPAEPIENLNTRISERLRHKNRALTAWDYERLVLEKFPEVYRAKCLPGGSAANTSLGRVEMIVVPDIRGLKLFDPFEPKLPFNVLEDIAAYLHGLAPPSAAILIKNPVYIQLRIRMNVKLHDAYEADRQYYLDELQNGLLRLLAPWAYDEGAELVIGGKFFPSLVIDFVEQQFYIDYVKDFRLLFGEENELRLASELQLQSGLQAPRPDGIWVSARNHLLDAGGDVGRGIGYMKVEVDLVIG